MKVTKIFAVVIVAMAVAVGMVSCAEKPKGESEVTDPTVDEKNILLDLPSFVKSVEGKTLDEIKAVLTKRGYSYVGTTEGINVFAINAKNLTIDNYTSEGIDYITTKTTIVELVIKDNGGIEAAVVLYGVPQDSATIKYSTIHKNAYAACKSYYPFAMDSEGELISGMQWAAIAMNLEDSYMWANSFINKGRVVYQIVKLKTLGNAFTGNAYNCFEGTTNKEHNLKESFKYWDNIIEDESKVIYETIIDGEIEVIEIIKILENAKNDEQI